LEENMTMQRLTRAGFFALLTLAYASPLLAADAETPSRYFPWHEPHEHSFWWIFPVFFFVMMIVMFVMMMRRGGMGCMWGHQMMDRPEYRELVKRYIGEPSESALDILDKRYAKGEIDKKEYEERKAVLSRKE
jgi:uncharacterized membrane protein